MVLFGATGDLAKRKLFPALFGLYKAKKLHADFRVIGSGRSVMSDSDFTAMVRHSIETFGRISIDTEEEWTQFISHFSYISLDVMNLQAYNALLALVHTKEKEAGTAGNRLFYLAIAPNLFGPVASYLKQSGLTDTNGWKRLVIEKPFGHDLASAEELNQQIQQAFDEEEIFRIDHYLGKEMVQNIEVIRFANSLFEPLWNNTHISNIQITASETVGVEERAVYYENAGALRDMVQNHMLQMIMMVCMEPPSRLKTEAIRDEKVKVLRSLRRYSEDEVPKYIVRGQYREGSMQNHKVAGYREEPNVKPDSLTETFVAAKLFIDNFRWAGVPIYIRTGKRMPRKSTEIVIQFKEMPQGIFFNKNGVLGPNLLIIRINPMEGMDLVLNAKKPGTDDDVVPISMSFCNNCGQETPEAYERLFYDAIQGDSTFFTRWDEVSLAWKFVDPIRRAWDNHPETLCYYEAGSFGPVESEKLLQQEQHNWWNVSTSSQEKIHGVELKHVDLQHRRPMYV
ncbi:glucose-6-phosphate dehydrogenase [Fodinisporobacter ferrooxydans]|uniref:Glucose-6-phosphate 1-dehydrogenase n=1 Tax=Fodinisporobacter ferrooxydans TaxID=2901836 RepID=A0ABY4CQM6_9BACL|nr:glucose-6-phosphate dehydrogenase [Alicyclobacillaceae bacterium MYW30-H2]